MIDREQNPNAENLNFAARAEAFLDESGWSFDGGGRSELERLKRVQSTYSSIRVH
jgi:hypothetical protein